MTTPILEKAHQALDQIRDDQLPNVASWLALLAELKDNPNVEPEELWLLASGDLKAMDEEMESAKPIDDWRKYFDEL